MCIVRGAISKFGLVLIMLCNLPYGCRQCMEGEYGEMCKDAAQVLYELRALCE